MATPKDMVMSLFTTVPIVVDEHLTALGKQLGTGGSALVECALQSLIDDCVVARTSGGYQLVTTVICAACKGSGRIPS